LWKRGCGVGKRRMSGFCHWEKKEKNKEKKKGVDAPQDRFLGKREGRRGN